MGGYEFRLDMPSVTEIESAFRSLIEYVQGLYGATPGQTRAHNRFIVESWARDADLSASRVRHRGMRRGPRWEAYKVELANLLERCNAREVPVSITTADVMACIDRAAEAT